MIHVCHVCLGEVEGEGEYHPRCVRGLFGSTKLPRLDIGLSKLHTAALAMVGHTSLSGVQKKISVSLSTDRETLQVATEGGRYILKPQTETYPALPENEHVTTRLATLAGIEIGACGLVALEDGTRAFIVRRFDRLADGAKVRQEDFCQLAGQLPREKYNGSAELCVRLVRKYATEPLVEVLKLYRRWLFAWWSGNGDMHLKNFSLQVDRQGVVRLTPAYDQVCTRLVIPNDALALPVGGKTEHLSRRSWLGFADYCGLPAKTAERVLARQAAALARAEGMVDASFLPAEQKAAYQQHLAERTRQLLP